MVPVPVNFYFVSRSPGLVPVKSYLLVPVPLTVYFLVPVPVPMAGTGTGTGTGTGPAHLYERVLGRALLVVFVGNYR